MSEKNKKRQIAKIIVFITSVFVILFSITYAFVTKTVIGNKKVVINAGVIDLVLEEENEITISDALPMYDQVGMIQEESFDFRLVNKGETPVNYQLKLVDVSTGNSLSKNIVRYGLTKNGNTTIDYVSTPYMGIIDSGIIQENEIYNYELRLWISDKVVDESKIANKSLSLKIEVKTGQLDETKYIGMLQTRKDTDAFWKYKESITSVVFENEISVPEEGIEESWDVSTAKDGSVMAYIEDDGLETDTYKLHIQGNDVIYANINSGALFNGFHNTTSIQGLEYFDTSNVTNMSSMFKGCNSLKELYVGNFDTSNVTDMSDMFGFGNWKPNLLTKLDVSNFDTSNVTNMSQMFSGCSSLTELDVSNFDTSNVVDMSGMFGFQYYGCSNLTKLDVSNFDTSNVTDMSGMFQNCSSLTELDVSNFDTSNVTYMGGSKNYIWGMFYGCSGLTKLDVSNFDTSNVTNMSDMFSGCSSLIELDVRSFNTTNVTNMSSIFRGCGSLTELIVSNFNTTNVTNMSGMFSGCGSLTELIVSNFDTSNVTNMSDMFSGCGNLSELDVRNFHTSNVTNMNRMFYLCRNLASLDLSNFDTSNVTNMYAMFASMNLTELKLGDFDTSNVTNMSDMFAGCRNLAEIDLSRFDTSNVTNMAGMFDNTSIKALDLSSKPYKHADGTDYMSWDTSNVTNMSSMFRGSSCLSTEITIRGNTTSYGNMFKDASTTTGALITVNYTADTSALVDEMIKTKSTNSNVVKGKEVE